MSVSSWENKFLCQNAAVPIFHCFPQTFKLVLLFPPYVSGPQVTSLVLERYCPDRSAEYEWRVTRAGGGPVFKQCFLYGAPELSPERCPRSASFHPQPPAGVMALYPRHGWSFIRIPGKEFFFFSVLAFSHTPRIYI